MKVLNISQDDWANFQFDNMMALRAVGLECDSVTRNRHPFYPIQSEIMPSLWDMREKIKDYDVIQFFHDNLNLYLNLLPGLLEKKVIVYHSSSEYRRNFDTINAQMNRNAFRSVCAMPEFIGKGAIEERYMVGAVDVQKLHWVQKNPVSPYVFAHYPSNPTVKGTYKIMELMSRTKANFVYSTDQVSYEEQLKRMSDCDIYIEMFSHKDGNGMPYGNFGITCLEAAAMGKIVITNCNDLDVYKKYYGAAPGIMSCLTEEDFQFCIQQLMNESIDEITELQEGSRAWVIQNHSYKATGEYFLKNILN